MGTEADPQENEVRRLREAISRHWEQIMNARTERDESAANEQLWQALDRPIADEAGRGR